MQRLGVALMVAVGLALSALVAAAAPAGASCAGDPSISTAMANGRVVFVGTVVSTGSHDRWATFAVEEVWSGDVADTQIVIAGPRDPGGGKFASSSVERTYRLGQRYVVDAQAGPGPFELRPGELQDNICSATTEWTDALAAQRPPAVRIVARDGPIETLAGSMTDQDGDGTNIGLVATVAAILAVVGLCLWLLFRRGSINDRADVDVPLDDDGSIGSVDGPGDEADPPSA